MTLGDIKIETLKIMFSNVDHDIVASELENLIHDDRYRGYLLNMTGALNRCMSSIEEKRVLPLKSAVLNDLESIVTASCVKYNLDNISDFYDVDRVIYESADGEYVGECEYRVDGNLLVLKKREDPEDTYTLLYNPSLERVSSTNEYNTPLSGIPDSIASYIPYFLKGELFREDEPNEAGEARNWYEQAMEEMVRAKAHRISSQESVKEKYSQGWL